MKIDLPGLLELHSTYASLAVRNNLNMPPDSFAGFVGWLKFQDQEHKRDASLPLYSELVDAKEKLEQSSV